MSIIWMDGRCLRAVILSILRKPKLHLLRSVVDLSCCSLQSVAVQRQTRDKSKGSANLQ